MKLNKKGLTLLEMMVVVIIIAGMLVLAYPNYLSSVEKGRASEAIRMVAHTVGAQIKYIADYGTPATSFKALDVSPSGTERAKNPTIVNGNTITTASFVYTMTSTAITAAPRGSSYNYNIIGNYSEDTILCKANDESGQKVCSSLGLQVDNDASTFKIE